jgi:Profilin
VCRLIERHTAAHISIIINLAAAAVPWCCCDVEKSRYAGGGYRNFCFSHAIGLNCAAKIRNCLLLQKLSPSRNQLLALAQSFTHLQDFSAASACAQQQLLQSHTPRNQHTQSNMSGWDAYVQTQLIASGAIAQGAILGKADLQLYAQEGGFEVSRQRLFILAILGCLHCTCLSEL